MPSSAASVSLSERRARWSGCRRSRSTRSARPATIPACGPPSSLSPEKQTRSAPAASAAAGRRLALDVDERAGAEVVEERQLVPASDGRELLEPRLLGEADDAEVRLVDAQEQRRLRPDRALVVGRPRPVRRPDLDQPRARAGEHVRDPEAVADLDQLAARDDDLAALRERGEREQHRGGVVVDDDRRLGAGEPAQQRRQVILARAARAGGEVVLEVRVAARRRATRSSAACGERRAAEVRVHEHAGRVEDAAERRPPRRGELSAEPRRAGRPARRRRGSPRARARARRARRRPRAGRRGRARARRRREGRCSLTETECSPAGAATLPIVRRSG